MENYLKNPYFWSWLNFDGEHYASIAYQGYLPLTYFYFPLYPLVTGFVSGVFGKSFVDVAASGLLVSNISFAVGLFGLWKLIGLDYKRAIGQTTLFLLLLFPTSFYFGAFYTEGLFSALIIWSFYSLRRGNFFIAGFLGALATAARITGLALIPAFAYEIWKFRKENPKANILLPVVSIILIPMGLGIYMYYLHRVTGDPLEFFNSTTLFGEQRSTDIVLLPQVFYRYFFKVLPNLNYSFFPLVFSTYLEIISAIIFLILGVLSFFRLRLSYAVYLSLGYLLPTLSGSFSSLPRYVIVLFPAFILLALGISHLNKSVRILIYSFFFIIQALAAALFLRGFWIS